MNFGTNVRKYRKKAKLTQVLLDNDNVLFSLVGKPQKIQ